MTKPATRRNPLWIPPFLGRVPEGLSAASLKLLGVVSLAVLFEEYDMAILTASLKHIARDLHVAEHDFGLYLAWIRAGAIPAFLVVPLADRLGRRPIFLWSTTLLGLFTFLTAFARTPVEFVLLQALTRTFFVASASVALVFIAEEFPAQHRGWGVGMLAALGSVGHGLGALVFSRIEQLPYGWRALYVFGVMPMLLLPYFAAHIVETTRFTEHKLAAGADHVSHTPWLRNALTPFVTLVRHAPLRAFAMALSAFLVAAAMLPTFQFTGYYTQKKLGWSPSQYATMVIALGAVGIIGNIVAGRLGDLFGRKRVGAALMVCFPVACFAFYGDSSLLTILAWIPLVFSAGGSRVILRSLSVELFPTGVRGAAAGLFGVMETLGAVSGLLLLYFFGTDDVDELARAVPMVAALVLGTACLLFVFPETRQRELEDISH